MAKNSQIFWWILNYQTFGDLMWYTCDIYCGYNETSCGYHGNFNDLQQLGDASIGSREN
jgi:hypothetical protein